MMRRDFRAFTLLELLLVIAIIGIVISLAMPSLGKVKGQAQEIGIQATIASHAKIMNVYLTDNRDSYPVLIPANAASSTYIVRGQPYTIYGYFGQVLTWQFGLAEQYYDGQVIGPLFQRPGRDPWFVSDYRYSASFLATPAFWSYTGRIGPEQWRGQRGHQVRYPSSKTLLVDDRVMEWQSYGVVALTDASARHVKGSDLSAPFPPGEGEWPGTWSSGRPGIHTVDGVHGRDLLN